MATTNHNNDIIGNTGTTGTYVSQGGVSGGSWAGYGLENAQQRKQRIAQLIISQVGDLERPDQISVLRAVAAFYEIEGELSS